MLYKEDIPEGAINGLFSINQWQRVFFSKGNLQFQPSMGVWRFADHQYDFKGSNNWMGSAHYIDLFACPKRLGMNYIYDWGDNKIVNGGSRKRLWRTLSWYEWMYIINKRDTKSGMRYAKAKVIGVNGVILFPDNWEESWFVINQANVPQNGYSSNSITVPLKWSDLEQHGAVFLPAAGHRGGDSFYGFSLCGGYWSSMLLNDEYAFALYFDDSDLHLDILRFNGLSVRLVYAKM